MDLKGTEEGRVWLAANLPYPISHTTVGLGYDVEELPPTLHTVWTMASTLAVNEAAVNARAQHHEEKLPQ